MFLAEWRSLPLCVGHPARKFFGHGFFLSSRPATAGRGDRALARWAGRGHRRSFCDDNEASRQTPPPPPFGWSPSPAIAGADARSRSRDAPWHPRFAARFKKARPTASQKEGRRSAERRVRFLPCPAGPGARHANECCHSSALRARSPFGAPPRYSPRRTHPDIGSALSPALPETRPCGALPRSAYLSLPRSAETGRNAGRAVTRGRPGAVCETARGNRTCSTF